MVPWLALVLQLQAGLPAAAAPLPLARAVDEDSLRDVERAHDAQAGFERGRRYLLPWSPGSGSGPCDVRIGRYCWWYDDGIAPPPAEPPEVARRREELVAELDALAARRPGDRWLAGMRVHYRLDGGALAAADSAARDCASDAWWCTALVAYAAQARGATAAADSAFADALAAMPDSTRCAWSDITVLLPGDLRDHYARLDCAARTAVESRYWLVTVPRLAARASEWRAEFRARRLLATLLASAVTPHRQGWGRDTEELTLRYGWPTAWSRIPPAGLTSLEPAILGHDPSPSMQVAPRALLLDSTAAAADDALHQLDRRAVARYAHHAIRRIVPVRVQLARFRRGDSTLVAAAWAASDDSLLAPRVVLGAVLPDGAIHAAPVDSTAAGHGQLVVPGIPALVGVEVADSARRTFGRARLVHPRVRDSTTVQLSDLLLYAAEDRPPATLAAALAGAIPGEHLDTRTPLGLFWEVYGADSALAVLETAVLVERIDRGLVRIARQRLGLADPDSPVQVRWNEQAAAHGGVAPRALSLDLSLLPAGRYRLTLSVTPATGAGVASGREIELR